MITRQPSRIAVAVSGGGRSLENLIKFQSPELWQVNAVISSSADCKAVNFARDRSLPVFIGNFSHAGGSETSRALADFIHQEKIEWIVLAGFLKLFPTIPGFHNRVVNIHPALLPKFGGKGMHGLHVHTAVLNCSEQTTGATVHFVNEHYDEGKIIASIKVPVMSGDSPEILAARVFSAECLLLPEVITRLVTNQLPLDHNLVWEMPFHAP